MHELRLCFDWGCDVTRRREKGAHDDNNNVDFIDASYKKLEFIFLYFI